MVGWSVCWLVGQSDAKSLSFFQHPERLPRWKEESLSGGMLRWLVGISLNLLVLVGISWYKLVSVGISWYLLVIVGISWY